MENMNFIENKIGQLRNYLFKKKSELDFNIDELEKSRISSSVMKPSDYEHINNQINVIKKQIDEINVFLDNYEDIKKFYIDYYNLLNSSENNILHFNEDNFLLINSPFDDVLNQFNDKSYCILSLNKSNLNSKDLMEFIKNTYLKSKDSNQDIYLAYGFLEFKNYYAPLFFIPVRLESPYDYKIFRNYNKEIILNEFLLNKLENENIKLPIFDGNINEFINEIEFLSEIKFIKKIYFGNFNLMNQYLYDDLNLDNWNYFLRKFVTYFDKSCEFSFEEIKMLNRSIANRWDKLNFLKNFEEIDILIKNLLANGKSVLYISQNNQIETLNKQLQKYNLNSLILTLNNTTTNNDFSKQINRRLVSDYVNFDAVEILKRQNELEKTIEFLKKPYLNFGLTPFEIEKLCKSYLKEVASLNKKYIIQNVKNYDLDYFKNCYTQITELINHSNKINNFKKYFNITKFDKSDFYKYAETIKYIRLYLDEFKHINSKLNNKYSIKLFDDLNSVSILENFNSLQHNPNYIEKEDRIILNSFIKSFLKNNDNIFENDVGNKFKNILNKYGIDLNEDFDKHISDCVNYSELIDENIILNVPLVTNNLYKFYSDIEYLYSIYKYLLKQLRVIFKFYEKYDFLNCDKSLFNANISFNEFKKLIETFNNDLELILNFNQENYENLVKFYMNLILNNKIEIKDFENIYFYNVYNSILTSFYNDFDNFKGKNLNYKDYELKLNQIVSDSWKNQYNSYMQDIFKKPIELNKQDHILNQKVPLINEIDKNDITGIKVLLNYFKDYITSNKRIFIMDYSSLFEYLDNSFENEFDYVIVNDENIPSKFLYMLPLILRSKHKIINVTPSDYHE